MAHQPIYVKTTYKNDPIYQNSKTVFTLHNNSFSHKFGDDLLEKVKMLDIEDNMLNSLKTADYEGFLKIGMQYADAINYAKEETSESLQSLMDEMSNEKRIEPIQKDNLEESYYNLYNELVG